MKHYIKTLAFVFVLTTTGVLAQNQSTDKPLKVKIKEGKDMVVIIDGKTYDSEILELIDVNKIESVSVLKDEKSKEKYKTKTGVIIIATKGKVKVKVTEKDKKTEIPSSKEPLILVNGKKISREEMSKIDPNDIKSIEVLKGEKAVKQYNAPDGVIIIKLKK